MKKISAKLFFSVLWIGLCQVIGSICKVFEYQGKNKFSRCAWWMLMTFVFIIVGLFALVSVCEVGEKFYNKYIENCSCDDEYCYHSEYINRDLYYHNTEDGKGYIYNKNTGEKLVKHVVWIAKPESGDSLICFSNGKKRGYFSKNTGRVVIEPKYGHAWIFSDGLASVEENGYIKFIDATGKVVIDKKMAYVPEKDGYVFHGGYCIVTTDDGERFGLMDKTGKMVLPMEYSYIYSTSDFENWFVQKGDEMALLDKELKPILPLKEWTISIAEGTVNVTMPDHTIRKYDMQGTLINDFYMVNVRMLEYEKDEIVYKDQKESVGAEYTEEEQLNYYHPMATARLRAYVAGDYYEGLMTADGRLVTMPIYQDIEAIGYDLYLCSTTNNDKVIVNGRGNIVKSEE